jgi:hypothetical protein
MRLSDHATGARPRQRTRWSRALAPAITSGIAAACATLAPLALPAHAQPAPGQPAPARAASSPILRPETAGRVVRVFDFEERLTTPSPVPKGWFRAQSTTAEPQRRPGFPHWNLAELDFDPARARSGEGVVRLPTRGGSTALALEPGAVPIFASGDYWVSAMVRTVGLAAARATLRVSILDGRGQEIDQSVAFAPLVVSEGRWTPLGVEVVGVHPTAAFLRIELLLLQPDAVAGARRDNFTIFGQDVSGEAYFDDVSIVQIPRVELTVDGWNNIVEGAAAPRVRASVRDLSGEDLSITFRVFDIDGRVVDEKSSPLGIGQGTPVWTPTLTRFGWYRVSMDVLGPDGRVGGAATDIIWAPARPNAEAPRERAGVRVAESDEREFGVVFTGLTDAHIDNVARLTEQANAGWASIEVWRESDDLAAVAARAAKVRRLFERMSSQGRGLTLALARVPGEVATRAQLPVDEVWDVLARADGVAGEHVSALTDRMGQAAVKWQIGALGDDAAFWKPVARLADARRELGSRAAAPTIVTPTRAQSGWDPRSLRGLGDDAGYLVLVDDVLSARGVGDLAAALADTASVPSAAPSNTPASTPPNTNDARRGAPERIVVMGKTDPSTYGVREGAQRLAAAMAEFWRAARPRERLDQRLTLAIEQPWLMSRGRRPQLMPTPELAVWRTLTAALAGRVVVGRFDDVPGVRGIVLAPRDTSIAPLGAPRPGGAVLLWNEGTAASPATVRAFFGGAGALPAYDCFGNPVETRLVPLREGHTGRALELAVGEWPVIIEGVDVNLVRFLAEVRLDQPFLESTNQVHSRALEVVNPWPVAITGRIAILEPGGFEASGRARDRRWNLQPRTMNFALEPGERARLPFDISFAPTEEVGTRPMVLRVDLSADRKYESILLSRDIEIGLPGVRMDLAYRYEGPGALDVVVEATITTTGSVPLTLDMTAFAPGLPRAKGNVTELTAGNRALIRFVFKDARERLKGQRVLVAAAEPDGGRRIAASVAIE